MSCARILIFPSLPRTRTVSHHSLLMSLIRAHGVSSYDASAEHAAPSAPGENLKDCGLVPSANLPGLQQEDNAAIAIHLIKQGTPLVVGGKVVGVASHDIPEGHRFATVAIPSGDYLNSWGLPFGVTIRDIAPGELMN